MRAEASILHLDLDAFFAAVEQRDKPSLRGKPVIVGGVGGRGVVSTASYEARVYGVHSAMAMAQARRLAPHAAVLAGRFAAYRESSRAVMALLGELSGVVEPMSVDEAYVDLAAGGVDCSDPGRLADLVAGLRTEVVRRTEGLTASVGVGTSKLIAKLASEASKPDGHLIVAPGTELDLITPLPTRAIPGIGPATMERLTKLGIRTVGDLQRASERELVHELGQVAGAGLKRLSFAQDDRPVQTEREAKSISVEDTFETDLTRPDELVAAVTADAVVLARQLVKAGLFARTITLKVRLCTFVTHTRSRTLDGATDRPERIAAVATHLLHGLETDAGVRLIGVGVSGFTTAAQEELFEIDDEAAPITEEVTAAPMGHPARALRRAEVRWWPGQDVEHASWGRGWVWGSGLGVVTVRFETRLSGIGPVRSLRVDDPALRPADPLPLSTPEAARDAPREDS
ncbi:MAG: DNA polymerase IV [Actinomycetia bacterium]|nr:DNA polymerase IV [Actinomycetes bacterium]